MAVLLGSTASCASNDVLDQVAPTTTVQGAGADGAPTTDGGDEPDDGAAGGDEEDEVREAHTRFMVELFAVDERTDDRAALLALAEELTTGAELQRYRDHLAGDDRLVGPGYDSNITEISIDGDYATVRDCSLDRDELYAADGELLTPADEVYEYRETLLVNEDGRWLVTDFHIGGDEQCEP